MHALIAQSGTVDLMKATSGDSSQAWFKASATLGCGAAEAGAKTVDCLRTKTGAEILSAVSATAASSSSGRGLNFGGFIPKPDGVTVFNDYPIRLARGEFIKVPMLIGNTENEMATFAPALGSAINALVSPRTLNAVFSCPAGTAAKAVQHLCLHTDTLMPAIIRIRSCRLPFPAHSMALKSHSSLVPQT